MASKEEYKHTKKHFRSEERKKKLGEEFEKKEHLARHHPTAKESGAVKKVIKKIGAEEKRQSRRLERHMGLS